MEIYLQEILVATAVEKLSEVSKKKVKAFAASFPEVLHFALKMMQFGTPPVVWHNLSRHMTQ